MRICGLFLAIMLAVAFPAFAEDKVEGKWEFTQTSPYTERTQIIEVKKKGKSITVSMETRDGQKVTGTGTVKGRNVSWKVSFDIERGPFVITYTGSVNAKGMKGKVEYGPLASGKWRAKKP